MSRLNKRQEIDSYECEKRQEQSEDMECFECSCMVCLAQEPTDLASGLERAIKIVIDEMDAARELNSQMALGMAQVLMLLELELKNSK